MNQIGDKTALPQRTVRRQSSSSQYSISPPIERRMRQAEELIKACSESDIPTIEALKVRGIDLQTPFRDEMGNDHYALKTAIEIACSRTVRYLLENGALPPTDNAETRLKSWWKQSIAHKIPSLDQIKNSNLLADVCFVKVDDKSRQYIQKSIHNRMQGEDDLLVIFDIKVSKDEPNVGIISQYINSQVTVREEKLWSKAEWFTPGGNQIRAGLINFHRKCFEVQSLIDKYIASLD